MKNKVSFILVMLVAGAVSQAAALTLKSGQVIGGDGNIYDGASPEQRENLIKNAQNSGDIAGVTGSNIFVVVGDTITFVPVNDIKGKSNDSIKTIIGDDVIQTVTGIADLTLADIETVQKIADESDIPLDELLTNDGLASLSAEEIATITEAAKQSGIDFDNLVAINSALDALPDDQFATVTEELASLIEDGFASEINETLDALSEIEGGLENLLKFNSIEECLAAGGSNCEQTGAAIDAIQNNGG
ncbi:MAG: hypothetical protein ACON44_03855 [Candidatus Puniceispirillaceae bacterium]